MVTLKLRISLPIRQHSRRPYLALRIWAALFAKPLGFSSAGPGKIRYIRCVRLLEPPRTLTCERIMDRKTTPYAIRYPEGLRLWRLRQIRLSSWMPIKTPNEYPWDLSNAQISVHPREQYPNVFLSSAIRRYNIHEILWTAQKSNTGPKCRKGCNCRWGARPLHKFAGNAMNSTEGQME